MHAHLFTGFEIWCVTTFFARGKLHDQAKDRYSNRLCAVRLRSPATPQTRNAQDSETGYVNSKGYKEPRNANNASWSD